MARTREAVALTERAIATLRPAKADYFVNDSTAQLLSVRVLTDGRKSYYIKFARPYTCHLTGKLKPKILLQLGRCEATEPTFIDLSTARRLAARLLLLMQSGEDVSQALETIRAALPEQRTVEQKVTAAEAKRNARSIGDLVQAYLLSKQAEGNKPALWSETTLRQGHSMMCKYVLPHWRSVRPTEFSRAHITKLLNSTPTANVQRTVRVFVAGFIKWAVRNEHLPMDFAFDLKMLPIADKPAPEPQIARAPHDPHELRKMLRICHGILNDMTETDESRRKAGFLLALAYTGLRSAAVTGIRRTGIHEADGRAFGTAEIQPQYVKSHGKRENFTVAIAPGLERVLKSLPKRKDDFFFVPHENTSTMTAWRRERIEQALGRPTDQHSFRSTFESRISEIGVSPEQAHVMTGHDPSKAIGGKTIRTYNRSRHAVVYFDEWMLWGDFIDWLIFADCDAVLGTKPFIDRTARAAFEAWRNKRRPAKVMG